MTRQIPPIFQKPLQAFVKSRQSPKFFFIEHFDSDQRQQA